jgi:hypothetical protein
MAHRKKSLDSKKRTRRQRAEPDHFALMRKPDVMAPATVRSTCTFFLKATHPEYMPHEIMALVKQGQAQLEPIAPGQVGALILDGFPYTVLGYYTLSEQDAEFEQPPTACSFHGPFYDYCQKKGVSIHELMDAAGDDFDEARQRARRLQEQMARDKVRPPRSRMRKH